MVPARPKFVTYFRVSTRKQGRSGLGLEAQQHAVRQYLFQIGGVESATFTEVESGKDDDRPQLAKALQRCRQTRATLLIAKLDRLSRSGAFLYRLRDDGTRFQALDIPEANTLTLGVMIAMTQHEREIISKRTREALARRKAAGKTLGNPNPPDLLPYQQKASKLGCFANRAKAQARAIDIAPAILEGLGITASPDTKAAVMAMWIEEALTDERTSLRKIAALLNAQGIQTPRGKTWTATAVRNAIGQIKEARAT